MRKNNLLALLLAAGLGAAACTSEMTAEKIRVEIPSTGVLKPGAAFEVVVAPFWLEKEVKEFDLNKDLAEYLLEEFKARYPGPVAAKPVAWTGAEMADRPEAWAKAALGPAGALVLTGKAAFSREARKALLAAEKRKFDDPFEPEKRWAERLNFELKIEVLLLKAETGEIVARNAFEDNLNYENTRQTPAFAFHDLLDRIKPRLLRFLFGSARVQERILLLKSKEFS
ncbi:MAG: hypothetical protein FJY82_01225 [Candidatus Aminicenantes bacterium]|nr:hypothetical protein [Candidatus Aminicenantes bacterium]